MKQLRYYILLIISCGVLGACEEKPAGYAPLVGRWQAELLQGARDVIEFGLDDTIKWTSSDQRQLTGAYRVDGTDLQVALRLYGDIKRATYTIDSLTDIELVLKSQMLGHHTVAYARTQRDNPEYRRLIVGRWVTRDGETAEFTAEGSLALTESDSTQHSGMWDIFDDSLEFTLYEGHHTIIKMTIISLTDTDLHLVSLYNNKKTDFRRAN